MRARADLVLQLRDLLRQLFERLHDVRSLLRLHPSVLLQTVYQGLRMGGSGLASHQPPFFFNSHQMLSYLLAFDLFLEHFLLLFPHVLLEFQRLLRARGQGWCKLTHKYIPDCAI